MSSPLGLVVRAGPTAAQRLREEGFAPDLFSTLVGASGGPKWLVLRHLDELWIERLLARRSTPLVTLGSSIGSFRHAAFATHDPSAAIARLAKGYVQQAYETRPTLAEISRVTEQILRDMLGEKGADEVASNEHVRSHFVVARRLAIAVPCQAEPTSR